MTDNNLYASNKRLCTIHCPYCHRLFVVEDENGRPLHMYGVDLVLN